MNQSEIVQCHSLLSEDPESRIAAANYLFDLTRTKKRVEKPEEALGYLQLFYQSLLNEKQDELAALLLWGKDLFDPEPRAVKLVWNAIDRYRKILVMGGSAQTKTYGASAKYLMRWTRDPMYTTIKLVSTTGGHAKSNIYSTFVRLHAESAIPLPGLVRQDYIGMSTNDLHSSIAKVSIQPGDSGAASMRGFHPLPRPKPHPIFGKMSFSIAIFDEAEGIPSGGWQGMDNFTATDNVQGYAATNPVNQSSEFGQRAMPTGGWQEFNREEDTEWEGQQGWHVVRLDPAKSENVVQKRMVFHGLMSYQGFQEYEAKGLDHPEYEIYARGRYPLSTAKYNVVPQYFVNDIKRICNFTMMPENVASLDPAFAEGGDLAILTTGRYGLCNGFLDTNSQIIEKIDPPRWMLNVEQQFPLLRRDTSDMTDDIIEICSNLHVRPEWFVIDATGNGTGVRDLLMRKFGPILSLMWGEAATKTKILEEDTQNADELYDGLKSEMYFAFARWIEFNYVKIHPAMQTQKLYTQLTSIRYDQPKGRKRRVETSAEFKANTKMGSPDEASSVIQLVHLCRIRGQDMPAVIPKPTPKTRNAYDFFRQPFEREEEGDSIEYVEMG